MATILCRPQCNTLQLSTGLILHTLETYVTIETLVAVNTNVISSVMNVQGVIVDNGVKIFLVVNFVL